MSNAPLADLNAESCADATLPNEGCFVSPPTLEDARLALADIKKVLKPPRKTGKGYKDPKIDLVLRGRLELMKMFLWQYTDIESRVKGEKGKTWIGASLSVAHAAKRGPWLAR